MKISDTYDDIYGSSGNGSYRDLGYDACQRRMDEEHETDGYRAWVAKCHAETAEPPAALQWHRCFRCGDRVDYHSTGNSMDPTHVYDYRTNNRHYLRCWGPRRR
jgi:hypothetical protein